MIASYVLGPDVTGRVWLRWSGQRRVQKLPAGALAPLSVDRCDGIPRTG